MIQAYNHNGRGGHMIAVQNVMPEDVDKYGIIDTGGPVDDRATVDIHGLVEKPAPADAPPTLAVIGRYIPDPPLFPALAPQTPGARGEHQIPAATPPGIGARSQN